MNQTETTSSNGRRRRSPENGEVDVLRRRISELERENEILRAASDFFARELDPRRSR
ncbi:hypothetical protein [Streptomyces kaniharaensis]|uniref:hypothetical protein n=1 Tax=Streptomyces kaniharaensis TaxID=212423 RepID=UPI001297955E|nr:hypothetical protein [Streptomyces kaniharaensis]